MAISGSQLVLVTGGTGFLGIHCLLALLKAGYHVRTTVRSLKREESVRKQLKESGELAHNALHNLIFVVADLMKDAGWADAVKDCVYVLHVASPFPSRAPKHEDELIKPAREGTLRVLRAAKNAGTVKRVVVTSSFAAMGHGVEPPPGKPYDETLWTPTEGHNPAVAAYHKSKTLAERAVWDFADKQAGAMELSVVNPVGVWGPVLGPDLSTSVILIQRLLNGDLPGCPNMEIGVIDVRDVADLHLVAMTHPKAKGERFLCVTPPTMTVRDISLALHERMGDKAKKSPTRNLPNFLLRIVALWDPTAALIIPELGLHKVLSNDKAKRLLGWEPKYSNKDAVAATGESLIELGLVKAT